MIRFLKSHPLWLLAALLMVAFVAYWSLFAARRYVSESHVIVENLQSPTTGMTDLPALLNGGGVTPSQDLMLLRDYLLSADMLAKLDAALGLREHYSTSYDVFSRMWRRDAPLEWFLDHYRTRVSAEHDPLSGVLVIRAQAYTPEMAHRIAALLVEEGERFMNELARKLMREQVAYAEREVADASKRTARARQSLVVFQNRHGLVSPTGTVETVSAVVARLEAELSDLQARRNALGAYLTPTAPEFVQVNDQINAVEKQLKGQRARLASSQGSALNTVADEYDRLVLDATFQQDVYRTALAALERARIDASRTLRKVSVLQQPTLPQYSVEPGRLYWSTVFVLATLILTGILQLLLTIVREHRD